MGLSSCVLGLQLVRVRVKIVSIVWVCGIEGSGLGEFGVANSAVCGKQDSLFSTWYQSGVRFAPCSEGHHPK